MTKQFYKILQKKLKRKLFSKIRQINFLRKREAHSTTTPTGGGLFDAVSGVVGGGGETPMLRWATGGGRGGGQPFRTALNRAQNTPVNPVVYARARYHASLAPLYIADSITCFTDSDRPLFLGPFHFSDRILCVFENWRRRRRECYEVRKSDFARSVTSVSCACEWFPQEMSSW